jgi:branched-chain amino acid transport system substrate-binding protein
MRKWRFVVVAMLATLSIVAAACGKSTSTGTSSKPAYKIGFMGALTGAYAQLVVGAEKGAKLAIKQANDKGDLPVTLSLDSQDTQGDKDKAVPLANKLAGDSKILAVVGPAFSGESLSSNPTLQQASIPQITPSATNPALAQAGWKAWFRAVGNDFSQGGPAPDVASKVIKGSKVYIAHDNSIYGAGLAGIVRDGLNAKYPGALVGFNSVDPGKDDYSDLASKHVASKADVFFWGGYSPESSKIITQAKAKGFKGTLLGADGSKDSTFLTNAGANGEGAYFLCPCADVTTISDPIDTKFVSDYKAFTNEDPIVYSGEGYDSANLIIEAIRKAGKPGSDITTYRKGLTTDIASSTSFVGTTKTYAFQANGELVDSAVVIYLYKVVGGKFVLQGRVKDLLAKA